VRDGLTLPVPDHLRDASYAGPRASDAGTGYGTRTTTPADTWNRTTSGRRKTYYNPTERGTRNASWLRPPPSWRADAAPEAPEPRQVDVPKKELRQPIRQPKLSARAAQLAARSAAACRLLCEQDEYLRAEIIMIFLSGRTRSIRASLRCRPGPTSSASGAPRLVGPAPHAADRDHSLSSGARRELLGIREPVEGLPVPMADIDLVVVPGLGFDEQGNRLGRGRGFYDRFLSHADFPGVACALAFEEQVVESIPVGPHDVGVDMLVTDQRCGASEH
jgi:5-formyltetrahydrofolate cyclo-ligase